MLSVGIAQYPVPDFRLTEQRRGLVLDASSQASCLALLPRCQTEGGGPDRETGASVGKAFKTGRNIKQISESVAAWKFVRSVPRLDSARQPDS
jgi:hypothetical protein